MLFPPSCASCGRQGSALCTRCVAGLAPAAALPVPPGLDEFAALIAYEGTGRALVVNLKYRNGRGAVALLARPLADLAAPSLARRHLPTVVTWAPTTRARRWSRGYDQAELLARGVARELGLPARRLLRRLPTPPQTGATRAQRLGRPRFESSRPVPASVLVIDDVRTSGATMTSAATALRRGGAEWLIGVALAQTPLNRLVELAE